MLPASSLTCHRSSRTRLLATVLPVAVALWTLALIPAPPATASVPALKAGKAANPVLPADAVNPFIGSGASAAPNPVPGGSRGDTFPGATVPFGEVQWSPDTPNAENPAGYNWDDSALLGFSLTHFSGAGCPNSGLFRVLPTVGDDGSAHPSFSHADETAHPGTYGVTLGNGINVGLTTTTRGGMGRFTFPSGSTPTVVVDATSADPYAGPTDLHTVGNTVLDGSEVVGDFCGSIVGYRMFLHAVFDTPFTVVPTGKGSVARLQFAAPPGSVVTMRVALSPVSIANATLNMQAELPGWDWAATAAAATARWNSMLGRVAITGGTAAQRTMFTTALYHSLLHPNVFSDVNGQYPGFDGQLHTVATGHVHYHTFSGWDIYRSQVQLLAMVVPDVASDIQATLLGDAETCGGGFPQWTLGNVESHVMIGDPGAQMVDNLDAFGVKGADPTRVLRVLRRSALDPKTVCMVLPLRLNLAGYLQRGYVSNGVSTTLEYASADAGIAQYAARHGDHAFADVVAAHATNWETQFNPASGYVQPRNDDGSWAPWTGPSSTAGYVEGNAAQYTWMVPEAYGRLVTLLGGRAVAVSRLDNLFEKVNAGLTEPHFYMGNEPQFTVPWAYVWAGAPSHTQDAVRRIIEGAFSEGPGGLPGNDDLGATSSWLVWASMGMFPVVPGQDVLVLNTPLFPQIVISVPGRQPIAITAPGAPDSRFVASALLNGKPQAAAWLRYRDLVGGASLAFTLDTVAGAWGSAPGLEPPSIGARAVTPPPPTTTTTTTPPAVSPTATPAVPVVGNPRFAG